jgi:hypothetical protein
LEELWKKISPEGFNLTKWTANLKARRVFHQAEERFSRLPPRRIERLILVFSNEKREVF